MSLKGFNIKEDQNDIKKFNRKMMALKVFANNEFKKGVQNVAANAVKIAVRRVPVKTGDLRRSIHSKTETTGKNHITTMVVAEMKYAGHVEYGTSKQKAQPYFFNSIRDALRLGIKDINMKIKKITKQ